MRVLNRMIRGLWRMPLYVRLWMLVLGIVNLLWPLFLLRHEAALIVILTSLLAVAFAAALMARYGLTRLLGAAHVFWVPLVPWLVTQLPEVSGDATLWLQLTIWIDSVSLLIGIIDVVLYARGARAELVEGL